MAATTGHKDLVALLLANMADENAKDKQGRFRPIWLPDARRSTGTSLDLNSSKHHLEALQSRGSAGLVPQ